MKRLMMLVAMMAFVLLLPMNVEAVNDLIINGDEHSTYVLDGNMTVDSLEVYSKLDLNGHTLTVRGDVIAEANVYVGEGALNVAGDYIQKAGALEIAEGGSANITGDFRVQDVNEKGEYVTANSSFSLFSGNSSLMVGGDTYINTKHINNISVYGTFVAKGDFIIESVPGYVELNCLCMEGKSAQKLQLPKEVSIEKLVFTNQNIEVAGYLNARMGSDATNITLDDGILETTFLDLNGYNMTIHGSVHADGEVNVWNGTLIVDKDHVQMSPWLSVSKGSIIIKENLRLQKIDASGNYVTGSGGAFADAGGTISVGKDLIIDSYYMFSSDGTFKVAGNINKTENGDFYAEHIILNGAGKQKVTLLGDSGIETLELWKERKDCTFTPAKCWTKLIQLEGLRNTPEGFKYYEDGNWADKAYKFVDFEGGKFLVANGFVATHINGLAQDPIYTDDWYYLSCGQAQTQYTGLAMYDDEWFYVEKGKLDTTKSGYVKYDGSLFYVGAGRYLSSVSGLAQDPNTGAWYFLANGQAQTQYTGLTQYDGKWFYVQKGILAEDFTGKVKYDGQYFNVVNGMVK